jgi:hypothetical protein
MILKMRRLETECVERMRRFLSSRQANISIDMGAPWVYEFHAYWAERFGGGASKSPSTHYPPGSISSEVIHA